MAEVHVFGRVTNDLQLKMSHRQVPYVPFGLVEWIGRRDTGHRQYFEVWAWGTAALSLADAEIHKDSRIWVQGFLELMDCTRNGGSEKDKRLKLSLTGGSGNLAVGDDVHGNLVIQETDDIEIDTVKAACNLDDIFLAHFFAAGILDNRNLAVQFAEIQILVDFHAHTGRNMI